MDVKVTASLNFPNKKALSIIKKKKKKNLTCAGFIHWPASCPLVLMWVVPFNAGQVRHTVVSTDHKYEAQHDPNAEIDPLICHGGYHFPGILAGVVPLHTGKADTAQSDDRLKRYFTQMSVIPYEWFYAS